METHYDANPLSVMRLLLIHPKYEGKGVEKALWNQSMSMLKEQTLNPEDEVFIYVHSDELGFFSSVGFDGNDAYPPLVGKHRYRSARLKDLRMCG